MSFLRSLTRAYHALGAPFRWLLGLFHSRVHGEARWMNRAEQRRFFATDHRGLVIAPGKRLSEQVSFTNLVLVAPTGSGKTTRFVIPNVLAVEGSVVVTDPSGEIFAATADHLRGRGFLIQALRPADPERSARFNPLAFWKTSSELRQLAQVIGSSMQTAHSDPFWSTSAINLLWIGLVAIGNVQDETKRNLGHLRDLLNHLEGEGKTTDVFMARHLPDQRDFNEYRAFMRQDSRVLTSILATARAALDLWSEQSVCELTNGNTIDLAALRLRRTAIYLIVPEHQVRLYAPLLNLFYSACFAHCLGTGLRNGDEPVYFFLDEFGNLGPVHNIAAIVTTLRKRRCSLSLILQDLAQLRATYGPDQARTIFSGGCQNKLFYSGLDLETAEYVERALGQNTVYDTTFGGVRDHARTLGVPLMRADEIRMMAWGEAVLLSGRERPVKIYA